MDKFWFVAMGVLITLVGLIFVNIVVTKEFNQKCKNSKGYVKHIYKSSICVSQDGRIIELNGEHNEQVEK